MSDSKPRVRFAPSPTGALHLGNALTGLFNYLYARRHSGTFLLRIEDTDRERSTAKLEQGITDSLTWLGITEDEGVNRGGEHGPYRQTERSKIYREHLDRLIAQSDVYLCYCTPEELDAEREAAQKEGRAYQYSGRCRDLGPEERAAKEDAGLKPALRFKVPDEGQISFVDEIRGEISFELRDIGDFVIRRSDGSPLYSVANVIDDALMQITHVIRGEEFISTTPSQILIGRALGFEIPRFAHLPLLLSPRGGKLSKREASVAVEDYQAQGYLPEAMVNFLVLLGWSPPGEEDFLTLAELEKVFDFDHVQKGCAQVDFEKLKHLNGRHIRAKTPEELSDLLLEGAFIPAEWGRERDRLVQAVTTIQERLVTLNEAPELLAFYFEAPGKTELPAVERRSERVQNLLSKLDGADFSRESLETLLTGFLEDEGLTPKEFFPLLRLALTGQKASPSIPEVLWALGPEESKKRLQPLLDE